MTNEERYEGLREVERRRMLFTKVQFDKHQYLNALCHCVEMQGLLLKLFSMHLKEKL